jgi:hypothetical protein
MSAPYWGWRERREKHEYHLDDQYEYSIACHFDHDGFLPHGSDERLDPLSEKRVGIECGESRLECGRVSRFVLKGTLSDKRCQVICQATSQTYLQ